MLGLESPLRPVHFVSPPAVSSFAEVPMTDIWTNDGSDGLD
jgi:hypothetical protein